MSGYFPRLPTLGQAIVLSNQIAHRALITTAERSNVDHSEVATLLEAAEWSLAVLTVGKFTGRGSKRLPGNGSPFARDMAVRTPLISGEVGEVKSQPMRVVRSASRRRTLVCRLVLCESGSGICHSLRYWPSVKVTPKRPIMIGESATGYVCCEFRRDSISMLRGWLPV